MNLLSRTFWHLTLLNGKDFIHSGLQQKKAKLNWLNQTLSLFLFFIALSAFSPYSQMPSYEELLLAEGYLQPLWCTSFFSKLPWEVLVNIVLNGLVISAFLNLFLWKRFRLVRILFFCCFFAYTALISSFGKVDHYLHIPLFTSFVLIFSHPKKKDTSDRALKNSLVTIFGLQVLIATAYFTSGVFKIYGILDQVFQSQISTLDPSSFARNIAKTEIATRDSTFYSNFIYEHPNLLWPVLLIGGYLVELLSIYAVFKPEVHRLWGLLLMVLHAGILLTVGPDFTYQMFMVACLFVLSPFHQGYALNAKALWNEHFGLSWNKTKPEKIIIYFDDHCLMCNRFIVKLSQYSLPEHLQLSGQSSLRYKAFIDRYPDMAQMDTVIVEVKTPDSIKIKSAAILQVLAHLDWKYRLILPFYRLSPFISNLVYDFIAKNRKKSPDVCPIPSEAIRARMI